jgi:hypothetical protein
VMEDSGNAYFWGFGLGWILIAGLGALVGSGRGQTGLGLLLGAILGPLGVAIACFLPKDRVSREEELAKGGLSKRERYVPRKGDPMEDWEAKERAKTPLPVPLHLRVKRWDEK